MIKEKKKKKNIMIMVHREMYEEFLKICEAEYLTMSEFLRSCIRDKIKEYKEKNISK